jgi:hypothetical protein
MDRIDKVITIRNESGKNIVVTYSKDSLKDTDSQLFYGTTWSINKGSTGEIMGVPYDSFFVFIYCKDSVDKYIMAKKLEGIVDRSFLVRYFFIRNSLPNNLFEFK